MSSSTTTMLVLLSVAIGIAVFQTPSASAAGVDCTSLVLTMADCLSYVSNDSTTTKPEGGCCSGLKQVLKTSPGCLCQAFQQSAQLGISLNLTKAMALPSACHVHAPASATSCSVAVSPAGAPAGTVVPPAGAPYSSIANPPMSTMGSGQASPAAAPSKPSSSSSIKVSIHLITAGIVAAFFTSF
ncbi:non-specific lipid transfer protein GPI-anchored 19-like [Silene latifolia]|uniref:non-specific lipid transfer protein GPI-anchored 19-like n=1 Tax=Silene latifolia TaxID=37657 RepID=UPI003D76B289